MGVQFIQGIIIGLLGIGGIIVLILGIRNKSIKKKIMYIIGAAVMIMISLSVFSLCNMSLEDKVYLEYTSYFKSHPNPANELDANDFANAKEYTNEFNKLNDAYDKEVAAWVANKYNITTDQAETIYVSEYMNRHS